MIRRQPHHVRRFAVHVINLQHLARVRIEYEQRARQFGGYQNVARGRIEIDAVRPPVLAEIMEKREEVTVLPNDTAAVARFIRERARLRARAA